MGAVCGPVAVDESAHSHATPTLISGGTRGFCRNARSLTCTTASMPLLMPGSVNCMPAEAEGRQAQGAGHKGQGSSGGGTAHVGCFCTSTPLPGS